MRYVKFSPFWKATYILCIRVAHSTSNASLQQYLNEAKTLFSTNIILFRLTCMCPKPLRCDEYLPEREKPPTTFTVREKRDKKNGCYLHRWNDSVGGCTCECRLLEAMSGKWVLSGKRRAALVRQSAPRPTERQSRFHGCCVFCVCRKRVTGIEVSYCRYRRASIWGSVDVFSLPILLLQNYDKSGDTTALKNSNYIFIYVYI